MAQQLISWARLHSFGMAAGAWGLSVLLVAMFCGGSIALSVHAQTPAPQIDDQARVIGRMEATLESLGQQIEVKNREIEGLRRVVEDQSRELATYRGMVQGIGALFALITGLATVMSAIGYREVRAVRAQLNQR